MDPKLQADLDQLSNARSPQRRAAAKRLRKRGDPAAGPALLAALKEELKDQRTWETQYQMIMAIGYCDYRAALPFLETLQTLRLSGMVETAVGDAMQRVSRQHEHDASQAVRFIDAKRRNLIHGAMQAIAMLRLVPDESTIERLVDYGLSLKFGEDDFAVVWLLRAAPGWPEPLVAPLLDQWSAIPFLQHQQIFNAVALARQRKYDTWSPL